jgi:hypothetical protein
MTSLFDRKRACCNNSTLPAVSTGREQAKGCQMQLTAFQHLESDWKLTPEPRHADPQHRFGLGQVQLASGVVEHRSAPQIAKQPTHVHLAEVNQQSHSDAPTVVHTTHEA